MTSIQSITVLGNTSRYITWYIQSVSDSVMFTNYNTWIINYITADYDCLIFHIDLHSLSVYYQKHWPRIMGRRDIVHFRLIVPQNLIWGIMRKGDYPSLQFSNCTGLNFYLISQNGRNSVSISKSYWPTDTNTKNVKLASPRTIIALALSYSVAAYAAPVWARSPHAHKLNTELNSTWKGVTTCPELTNVEDLYLLAGIAPPAEMYVIEWKRPNRKPIRSTLYMGNIPQREGWGPRTAFLRSVKLAEFSHKVIRCNEWLRRLHTPHNVTVNLSENLSRGYDSPWMTWRCRNRLRQDSYATRNIQKWVY